MNTSTTATTISKLRSLPLWALVAGAAVAVLSLASVATLSVSTVTTNVQLTADSLQADSNVTIANNLLTQSGSAISAAGTASNSSVDATIGLATVTPGITANHWMYAVDVKEAAAGSWGSGACYKVELFTDGTLAGTGYIKNSTADGSNVEGVNFKIDAGATSVSSLASTWTSKVTATASCS